MLKKSDLFFITLPFSFCKKIYCVNRLFVLILCLVALNFTTIAAPADLDPNFGDMGKVISDPDNTGTFRGIDMALQADGKIVMIGSAGFDPSPAGFIIARYNADGSPDTSFDNDGWIHLTVGDNGDRPESIAIQADGKIVAGVVAAFDHPELTDFGVVRLNPDGSLDTTFDGDGKATVSFDPKTFPSQAHQETFKSLKIADDGKIVLAGTAIFFPSPTRFIFARLNPNGSIDNTFGTDGKSVAQQYGRYDELNDIEILSDGSIIVAGNSGGSKLKYRMVIKYDNAGTEVWSYLRTVLGLGTSTEYAGVSIQPDGKIVAVGEETFDSIATRLNADGTEDESFEIPEDPPGGGFDDVKIQTDGKILANFSLGIAPGNGSSFCLIRYNTDGSLDSGFGDNGLATNNITNGLDFANRIITQTDGKILVGGYSRSSDSPRSYYFTIVRYQGGNLIPQTPRFDYDGDGKSDISVFRPSNGVWYLNQSTNGFVAEQFGISTDKMVPADFDGDGKTDIAIYRDGVWWILQSSDSSVRIIQFGIAEDKPQSGDFDGDNIDDLVVFRPSNGTWYVLRSSDGGFYGVPFGISEDIPQSSDYDGDGITDIAVWRPSNSTWYVQKSLGGNLALQFGANGDLPMANDYDGDGNSDLAVWRPAEGDWYIFNSSSDQIDRINFGIAEDIPVPADYDGDGKTDIAIWRPSNSVWYRLLSTTGWDEQLFGVSNDRPTPGAYNP